MNTVFQIYPLLKQARSQRFALGGSDFKTQKATPTFVSSLILLQY